MNSGAFSLGDLLFYAVALITLSCGAYSVFSRNIVRAVFSLLGTFFGVAVLYAMLSSDFVAIVQLLVYVGGILVLMLFAVMLTSNIETASKSSRAGSLPLGIFLGIVVLMVLGSLALQVGWEQSPAVDFTPTTLLIGDLLLKDALLPFEVVALVLLGVVIGSVVVARAKSEPKQLPGTEKSSAQPGDGESQP